MNSLYTVKKEFFIFEFDLHHITFEIILFNNLKCSLFKKVSHGTIIITMDPEKQVSGLRSEIFAWCLCVFAAFKTII